MNCPNCGTSNLDNSSICVNCGRPLNGGVATTTAPPAPPEQQATYTPPPPQSSYTPSPGSGAPPNYLWQAIVLTILCCNCFPLGIVAIIFAAQVNSKFQAGDLAGAMQASKNAKLWCIITAVVGLLCWIIWLITSGAAVMEAIREAQANA